MDEEQRRPGRDKSGGGDTSRALAFYEARLEAGLREEDAALRKAARGKVVLSEEDYVDSMEAIITRDFFPDLPRVRAKLEYLESLESENPARIAAAEGHLLALVTPGPASEAGGRTPAREGVGQVVSGGVDGDGKRDRDVPLATLDRFLARHTSEDNASFAEIHGRMRQAHRDKLWWTDRARLEDKRAQEERSRHPTAPQRLHTDESRGRQAGDRAALTVTGDSRPTQLDAVQPAPTNSLYWTPDGLEAVKATMGPPPAITHKATRMPARGDSTLLLAQPAAGARGAGEHPGEHPGGRREMPAQVWGAGMERPATGTEVNGFTIVPGTPALTPGGAGESPMMTWGEVASTPLLLHSSDADLLGGSEAAPRFCLPAQSRRDEALHELADKAKAHHARGGARARPSPAAAIAGGAGGGGGGGLAAGLHGRSARFDPTPPMSPAAAKLAARLGKTTGAFTPGRPGFGAELRKSYAATPDSHSPLVTGQKRKPSSAAATPRSSAAGTPAAMRRASAGTPLENAAHPLPGKSPRLAGYGAQPVAPSTAPAVSRGRDITDGLLQF
mmetsp:Transcript_25000/g.77918  ORF Transcript_25000/g.77918 Transcript_25000/m.77918 type:complete len:559 (+) Transcript_25000:2-1678(+)